MIKRASVIFLLIAVFLISFIPLAWAGGDSSLKVIMETDFVDFDVQPIIENGRVLVPIRTIAEKLDFKVDWNKNTNVITIKKKELELKLLVNDKTAFVGSKPVLLNTPPKIVAGRTMVPLRFISENLGQNVVYSKLFDAPCIWITSFKLLNEKDVKINDNYIKVPDEYGPPIYYLKENGKTVRNIKLGDSLEKVKSVYGSPFRTSIDDTASGYLIYTTTFMPYSGGMARVSFKFENGVLKVVSISLGT